MLTAKDIMTEEVVTIRETVSVEEAMRLLLENEITGMPVVDEEMNLVGMITEKDLLRLYDKAWRSEDFTVEDFMTTPAVHFDEDEGFDAVCRCLCKHMFRRVPVTSGGKVTGIISRPDIIKYILKHEAEKRATDVKKRV